MSEAVKSSFCYSVNLAEKVAEGSKNSNAHVSGEVVAVNERSGGGFLKVDVFETENIRVVAEIAIQAIEGLEKSNGDYR
jgi:predicted lipoprotein